ncbi:MAG: glycosyltransferase [Flavobacteriales bacterium]
MPSKNICVLTKTYPFGVLESYLNNEIPILSAQFDHVFIYAVDDYKGEQLNPIIAQYPNVHILLLNKKIPVFGFLHKVKRTLWSRWQWLVEMVKGRDGKNHWINRSLCFSYMGICYDKAHTLSDALKQQGVDQILFYNYWLHRGSIISSVVKNKLMKGSVVVSRAHSSDLYHRDWNTYIQEKKAPFMPFERFKVKNSDFIFPISNHGRKHLERVFQLDESKQKVARLGVIDQGALAPIPTEELFTLVTCSWVTENKRVIHIPEILSKLSDLHVRWIHLGPYEGEEGQRLIDEIQRRGLQDKIELTGHLPNGAIFDFYRNQPVGVILNLSKAEGIPVSLMEAISFGIPGIVTRTIGNPEIIDDSCGKVIDLDFSTQEVADAIREMINNKAHYLELRKGARTMFERHYNAVDNYNAFYTFLKERFSALFP